MKTWVRVNEDGRRIGESHTQAVLSDVEVDALLAERAVRTLWPHLHAANGIGMAEALIREFM